MRKRLRKKLRMGEFRQFGFEVRFRLPDELPEAGLDAFWDSFIDEAVEARGLLCGGTCGRKWDVFVTRSGRDSATDEDRRAVAVWLEQHPMASAADVGPLVDAWHSA